MRLPTYYINDSRGSSKVTSVSSKLRHRLAPAGKNVADQRYNENGKRRFLLGNDLSDLLWSIRFFVIRIGPVPALTSVPNGLARSGLPGGANAVGSPRRGRYLLCKQQRALSGDLGLVNCERISIKRNNPSRENVAATGRDDVFVGR